MGPFEPPAINSKAFLGYSRPFQVTLLLDICAVMQYNTNFIIFHHYDIKFTLKSSKLTFYFEAKSQQQHQHSTLNSQHKCILIIKFIYYQVLASQFYFIKRPLSLCRCTMQQFCKAVTFCLQLLSKNGFSIPCSGPKSTQHVEFIANGVIFQPP